MKDIEESIGKIKNPRLLEQMDQRYTAYENDIIRLQTMRHVLFPAEKD